VFERALEPLLGERWEGCAQGCAQSSRRPSQSQRTPGVPLIGNQAREPLERSGDERPVPQLPADGQALLEQGPRYSVITLLPDQIASSNQS